MLRRVSVTDLKKGFYVVDQSGGKPLCPPLYSLEGYILSEEEPERLARSGFQEACIDDERTALFLDTAFISDTDLLDTLSTAFQPTVSYQEEFERACQLYSKTLDVAKEVNTIAESRDDVHIEEIHALFEETLASLRRNANALCSLAKLKAKDEYTFTHCVNVAILAVIFGKQLGIKEKYLVDFSMAGFFHDIGKIFIPSEILNYPGPLDVGQFNKIKEHPDLGCRYLSLYPAIPQVVLQGTRDHHERYNGQGYPSGRQGENISLAGRLLAVVDVYDALSSKRCYKEASTPAESLSVLYQNREQDFTPGFVEHLINALGVYPSGSLIRLSNRYCAVVLEQNEKQPLRPKVVLLVDAFGSRLVRPKIVDLSAHINLTIAGPLLKLPVELVIEEAIRYAR